MIRSGFSWELWSRSCLLKSAKKEQLGREGGMIGGLVGGGERLARRGLEGGVGGLWHLEKQLLRGCMEKTDGHLLLLSPFLSTQTQQLDAAESVARAGNYTSWQDALEIWTDC